MKNLITYLLVFTTLMLCVPVEARLFDGRLRDRISTNRANRVQARATRSVNRVNRVRATYTVRYQRPQYTQPDRMVQPVESYYSAPRAYYSTSNQSVSSNRCNNPNCTCVDCNCNSNVQNYPIQERVQTVLPTIPVIEYRTNSNCANGKCTFTVPKQHSPVTLIAMR